MTEEDRLADLFFSLCPTFLVRQLPPRDWGNQKLRQGPTIPVLKMLTVPDRECGWGGGPGIDEGALLPHPTNPWNEDSLRNESVIRWGLLKCAGDGE